MAQSLSALRSTKDDAGKPPIVILYGVDGVGKTSLAAEFPSPIYLPTEGEAPPNDISLMTFDVPETLDGVLDNIGELLTQDHDYKTLIVDSLDGLEPLVWAATCRRLDATSDKTIDSIEAPGYGKGYVEADTEWREYLKAITALRKSGVGVVQIAHPEIVRFDSPVSDPYSRYGIKLHKRAAALTREAADIVGFLNYRVSIKEKEVGFKKTVAHGESGGDRQIHLEERAGFVAKNRYGMPAMLPYKKGGGYAALAKYLPARTAANDNNVQTQAQAA